MRNLTLFFSLLLIVFGCKPEKSKEDKMDPETKKIITEITEKYAPDKRVAIFDVDITKNEQGKIVISGETNIAEAKDELVKKLKERFPDAVDEFKILPLDELEGNVYGIVNLSVCNIRSKPHHWSELATQALLGTTLKVYKSIERNSYFLVQTPDNYISWLDDDGLVLANEKEVKEWQQALKIIYTKHYGFTYSEADAGSQHVSDIVMGDMLKFLGEENDFYKVEYPDKRVAYIEKEKGMPYDKWLQSLNPTPENIVKTAKTLMGLPYLWGGTSTKAVDCSGFTKVVYFMNGIILERDASLQTHTGELVDTENGFDNLQAGDLLFFGKKATADEKEKVTHVGIYIGDMEYIHASGRVKINSFDKTRDNYSEYRYNSFIRARRILTSIDKNGIVSVKKHTFPF